VTSLSRRGGEARRAASSGFIGDVRDEALVMRLVDRRFDTSSI